MIRILLTIARLCSAMWVGAALLYVATSVTEQVQPTFDADTKDTLALIRFPWYYGTGGTLLLVSAAASIVYGSTAKRRTVLVAGLLLVAAVVLMQADYFWVYRPMRDLLAPAGPGRGPVFDRLHDWSEWLNVISLLLAAAAAVILAAVPLAGSRRGEDLARL